jgi:hypothetical protein
LDLVADTTIGATNQTNGVDTIEMTPRLGVRFHLFSRIQRFNARERAPRRRIVVRDLVRVESRNLFYSGDTGSDSTVRFRNRLELLVPLNKARVNDDGARYLIAGLGVVHPARRSRRALRQPATHPRGPRLPPQLQLAVRSTLHLDAVAQHHR